MRAKYKIMVVIRGMLMLHFEKFVRCIECQSKCQKTLESVSLDDSTSLSCEMKREYREHLLFQQRQIVQATLFFFIRYTISPWLLSNVCSLGISV